MLAFVPMVIYLSKHQFCHHLCHYYANCQLLEFLKWVIYDVNVLDPDDPYLLLASTHLESFYSESVQCNKLWKVTSVDDNVQPTSKQQQQVYPSHVTSDFTVGSSVVPGAFVRHNLLQTQSSLSDAVKGHVDGQLQLSKSLHCSSMAIGQCSSR